MGPPLPRPKRVRVFFVDADATDSDSSGGEGDERAKRRVREVIDIDVRAASTSPAPPKRLASAPLLARRRAAKADAGFRSRRFRGVRRRPWGRYSAEIRDPSLRKRLWLGTFDTAEEAAAVYDDAALRLKGTQAVTNFPSTSASASAKRHPPSQMKLRPRRETALGTTTTTTATTTATNPSSAPAPSPQQPQPRTDDDVAAFYPFASPTSVLRYAADEALPPAFDLLYGGLGELGDLAATPASKAAEFDWLPWWESEDFVTAGLTASAVSVK